MAAPSATDTPTTVARSLLTRNVRLKPGERVTIEAWPHTLPWAVALAREARRLRALPVVVYEDEASYWDSVEQGELKQLGAEPSHEWASLGKTNVYIHMWGPGDRVRLNGLPPRKSSALFRFNDGWYRAARRARLRGLRLELGRPYPTLARAYGVDLGAWTHAVAAASAIDPAALARAAAPIARALERGRRVRITHPNGTDLTLGLAGYPPRTSDGRPTVGDRRRPFDLLANVPSGSVRVPLDETVAEGRLVGNRTCYYEDGVARGPELDFSDGRLTGFRFASGGERFEGPYAKGGRGRDQPGLLAVGLNPALHDTPQLEDVEAGALMVAVGGNGYYGGKNRSPFFGWGIVAGGALEVDGRPVPLPRPEGERA